jgi:hypothetical protein
VIRLQLPDDRRFDNARHLAEAGAKGYESLVRRGTNQFEVIRSDKN